MWEIGSTSADLQPDEPEPAVELVLTDNDYTRAMWCVPTGCRKPPSQPCHQQQGGTTSGAGRMALGFQSSALMGLDS